MGDAATGRYDPAGGTGALAGGGATSVNGAPINTRLAQTLSSHFIGVFDVPLRCITVTALVRQVNDRGLETVTDSIKRNGWMPSSAPTVVISREFCPGGEWATECTTTGSFKVLDGNHGITAAKKLFDGETRVAVRVYYEFNPAHMRILGDGE